ncbi:MAG TPA: heme exporter protein CcmD [Stellaceae bacterium]|nr:heme exporter protein CcmD [Stellaceae bacterium]
MLQAIGSYLAMGGYAVFVWPAYAVAFVVLGGLALYCRHRYRRSTRSLETLQRQLGPRR